MNSTSRTLLTLAMLAPLAACQTTPTTETRAVCAIWQPVTFSASGDTSQTVAEVRAANAKRDAFCK